MWIWRIYKVWQLPVETFDIFFHFIFRFICRCIARQIESSGLYGNSILQKTEVDHWLTFCLGPLSCGAELQRGLVYLDSVLLPTTFLVGSAVRQVLKIQFAYVCGMVPVHYRHKF
jgi:hypothetical protein